MQLNESQLTKNVEQGSSVFVKFRATVDKVAKIR